MLKALRSYWAFTNNIYKIVVLVLLPVVLVLINVYVYQQDVGTGIESFLVLYAVDVLSDIFFMRGFYRKGNDTLGFMQSSPRFRRIIVEVTAVDAIRRIMLYQIPYVTLLWCARESIEIIGWLKEMAVLPWGLVLSAQFAVLAARHFVVWNQVYACTAVGYMIMATILVFVIMVGEAVNEAFIRGGLVLFIVLVFVTAIGTIWYTDKKMRESYYD